MEIGWNQLLAMQARFANWTSIYEDTHMVPNATEYPYATVLRHYARGMAAAAVQPQSFSQELQALQSLLPMVHDATSRQLAAVANLSLVARGALMRGENKAAIDLMSTAAEQQLQWQ